ncbi:MAG: hypothetical protein AABY22_08775 [Nanoarchaeota archaeon]
MRKLYKVTYQTMFFFRSGAKGEYALEKDAAQELLLEIKNNGLLGKIHIVLATKKNIKGHE